MVLVDVTLLCIGLIVNSFVVGALPAAPATEGENSLDARRRFAPLWMGVPKYQPDEAEAKAGVPAAAYAVVWEAKWQEDLGLSAKQKEQLSEFRAQVTAEINEHAEQFTSLPADKREAEVKSWNGGSSPWRMQIDDRVRREIEAVLTPGQLQSINEFSFPRWIVGSLYDGDVRREIGISAAQEDQFRSVAKEQNARMQEEYMQRADRSWDMLTPQQQAEMPEVVKRQGPTSATLSLAFFLGFDRDAMGTSYPLLVVPAVRDRLELSATQKTELLAVIKESAAKAQAIRERQGGQGAEPTDQAQIEAVLTPQQLATLKDIDFRRKVVLAMGYPEKRKSIGISQEQEAAWTRIVKESHDEQFRIDSEMVAKAVEILTPAQRDQMRTNYDRRFGG